MKIMRPFVRFLVLLSVVLSLTSCLGTLQIGNVRADEPPPTALQRDPRGETNCPIYQPRQDDALPQAPVISNQKPEDVALLLARHINRLERHSEEQQNRRNQHYFHYLRECLRD